MADLAFSQKPPPPPLPAPSPAHLHPPVCVAPATKTCNHQMFRIKAVYFYDT